MARELEILCDLLDDELERQHNVCAVCEAQHEALIARDLDAIDARNIALNLLARETAESQAKRQSAVKAALSSLGVSTSPVTLSALIEAVDEPWRSRLSERRQSLRETMERGRALVRRNGRVAVKSKRVADQWLNQLFCHLASVGPSYNGDGEERAHRIGAPVAIDQRG